MSRTKINVSAVIDATGQINSAKTYISSAKSSFTQTKNSIDGKIKNRSNIRNRLDTVQSQLSNIDSKIGRIRSTVQSGANQYRSTDEKVESWKKDLRNNVGVRAVGTITSSWASYFKNSDDVKDVTEKKTKEPSIVDKKSLWSWEDTWDVIGEFGPIGTGVSAVGQFFTGGTPCKSGLKFLKGAADITGDVAKNISSNTSFDWQSLTNIKTVQNETAGKVFGDAIDDYNFSKAPNTAGKVAVAAKWVGTGLTVATTAYDNFVDEENSVGRSIAETVGESAVKVVTGVACKAAATAIVTGIAATVGAPAVATAAAIGVVAVGISWAADKVCEAITGKDLAEATSDLVLDTAEKVGKAVGSAAKKVAGKVSGWWNKLWG